MHVRFLYYMDWTLDENNLKCNISILNVASAKKNANDLKVDFLK